MTDLEPQRHFVNPSTGEALTLASSDNELGRYLADLRELESRIREEKRIVQRELLSRMDRSAKWTVYAGEGVKLTGQSPKPQEEFEAADLYAALVGLVDDGVLSIEAVDAAVQTVVSYRAQKRGVNALRALGGRVREVVDAHAREVEKDRYVSVSVGVNA